MYNVICEWVGINCDTNKTNCNCKYPRNFYCKHSEPPCWLLCVRHLFHYFSTSWSTVEGSDKCQQCRKETWPRKRCWQEDSQKSQQRTNHRCRWVTVLVIVVKKFCNIRLVSTLAVFEVHMMVWFSVLCGLFHCLRGIYCCTCTWIKFIHPEVGGSMLIWMWKQTIHILHGIKTQKTTIILTKPAMNSWNLEYIWGIFDAHSIMTRSVPILLGHFIALLPLTDYCNKWISLYLVWALPRA